MIAVMSGSFLQRGEPAMIDKFHRTKACLESGIDIVLELPYAYAVQSSSLFAKGSVQTLNEIGVHSICFGSESGDIEDFIQCYNHFKDMLPIFQDTLKQGLKQGLSYPLASKVAYKRIGLTSNGIDLSKPNNILGFSYIREIMDNRLQIKPFTIKRLHNDYHDTMISGSISSATSIREKLVHQKSALEDVNETLPPATVRQLESYQNTAGGWHSWDRYFSIVRYRVLTMSTKELSQIAGIDEGIEYRIKKTAKHVTSFSEWVQAIKSKRYTWTRIQRMFVHILTNVKKSDIHLTTELSSVPYIRLLGFTENGQAYLNTQKKVMNIPLVTSIATKVSPILLLEEQASNAYYSILPPETMKSLIKQEMQPVRG